MKLAEELSAVLMHTLGQNAHRTAIVQIPEMNLAAFADTGKP